MLPIHWPRWAIIPIAFVLILLTAGIGLALELTSPPEEPMPVCAGFMTTIMSTVPFSPLSGAALKPFTTLAARVCLS